MLNEYRAWVMSILKDSESSKKIDCVINTVESASKLIVHAINILDLSVFRAASGKAVSLISYFCTNILPIARKKAQLPTAIKRNNKKPYRMLLKV
jgi:hypothetical protein